MSDLKTLIEEELALPVDPRVGGFAASIAAQYGDASKAVLFYGSCLRTTRLDGQMLDFYLIVSSYEEAYGKSWLVKANKLLPPNVFPAEHDGLVAKVAVLSEDDFYKLNRPEASAVSVWARFAQPSRLVWSADEAAKSTAIEAIKGAPMTLFALTLPMLGGETHSISDIWRQGFELTYGAELRAERGNRPGSVVDADPQRYDRFGLATLEERKANPEARLSVIAAGKRWKKLRRNGKLLTLARLAKASGTYAGGIDYLAWKINRHAGTDYEIKPWQRKWPILGAIVMLPRLLIGGAIK
ncbi:FIG00687856: Predicted nucleotidyltransferases [hydrothermal vent metagenome]|uniref:FIG00687856: Predicted nucleotidyltransferases n=1 Tax=hydrothermal vent metagenome TaxID=652676 RepID=A0A3B0RN95_9ZZZZ